MSGQTITDGDSDRFADALLTRIVIREKARPQTEFLRLLNASQVADELIFRGSTALHGIHLSPSHQWFAGDLDFIAEKDVVRAFRADPASFGLPLKHRERADGSSGIVCSYCGVVWKRLLLPVDVCHPHPKGMLHEPGIFRSAEGKESIPVKRVMPLVQTIAEKVDAVTKRQKTTDFLDLWFALGNRKIDMADVRSAFDCRSGSIPFHATVVLENWTLWRLHGPPTSLLLC